MADYKYKNLFLQSHVDKQLKIAADDRSFTATNEDIHFEDFELTESLCSDSELRFGSCEASMVKFQIRNAFIPIAGKWLTVTETLEGNTDAPFQYGRYKVFSDVPTADKEYRDIVAYDAMYDILGADMAAWYNSILPEENSSMTLRQFRESFVRHFGLTEVVPQGGLVNDGMMVQRSIQPEQISGRDVITAICEINGCFGHIGRDGKFHYIYLPQAIEGLYPANDLYPDHAPDWMAQAKTGHLYPQDPKSTRIGKGSYIKCQYEDYRTRPITMLQIRQQENDIGKIWPEREATDKDNCYIIQDNFLVYGKSSDELTVIAQNIISKITDIIYRPFDCIAVGNPCLEVGDPIRLNTKYEIVESYILARTMKGIQALRDTYSSEGVEKYAEKVNGVHKSIIQLKGKANILTRTIEETKLEMYDIENGLNNTITVTAGQIRGELTDTANGLSNAITATAGEIRGELKNEVDGLNNTITVTAGQIRGELTDTANGLSNAISVTAGNLSAEIKNTKEGLESAIEQTAKEIKLEVFSMEGKWDVRGYWHPVNYSGYGTPEEAGYGDIDTYRGKTYLDVATGKIYYCANDDGSFDYWFENYQCPKSEETVQSQIKVNSDNINLRVEKGSIISEINQSPEAVAITAQKIDLNGLVNAEEFMSKYATINTLEASTAILNNVIAEKASIADLEAAEGRIGNLESETANIENLLADKATIGQLNAVNGRFENLNASNITTGTLSVDRIDVDNLTINSENIEGTRWVKAVISVGFRTIEYLTPGGKTETITVATSIITRDMKVLEVGAGEEEEIILERISEAK